MTDMQNIVPLEQAPQEAPVSDDETTPENKWGQWTCPECGCEVNYSGDATEIEHLCYGEQIPEGAHIVQHPENGPHAIVETGDGAYRKATPQNVVTSIAGA